MLYLGPASAQNPKDGIEKNNYSDTKKDVLLSHLSYADYYFAHNMCETLVDNIDDLVKSRKIPFFVIPAKAGIQSFQIVTKALDSGFQRSDDFLRNHQH